MAFGTNDKVIDSIPSQTSGGFGVNDKVVEETPVTKPTIETQTTYQWSPKSTPTKLAGDFNQADYYKDVAIAHTEKPIEITTISTNKPKSQVIDEGKQAFADIRTLNEGIHQFDKIPVIKQEKDNILGISVPIISQDYQVNNNPTSTATHSDYLKEAEDLFTNPQDYTQEDILTKQGDISKQLGNRQRELQDQINNINQEVNSFEARPDVVLQNILPFQRAELPENLSIKIADKKELQNKLTWLTDQSTKLDKALTQLKEDKATPDFNNPDVVNSLLSQPEQSINNEAIKIGSYINSSDISGYTDQYTRAFQIDPSKVAENSPILPTTDNENSYQIGDIQRENLGYTGVISMLNKLVSSSQDKNSPENKLGDFDEQIEQQKQEYKSNPTKEEFDKLNGFIDYRNKFYQESVLPKQELDKKLSNILETNYPELKKQKETQDKLDKTNNTFFGNVSLAPLSVADVLYNELTLNSYALAKRTSERVATSLGDQTPEQEASNINLLKENLQDTKLITPQDWNNKQVFERTEEGDIKLHPEVWLHATIKTALESLALGYTGVAGGALITPTLEQAVAPNIAKYTGELLGMTASTAALFGHDIMSSEEAKGLSSKDAYTIGMMRSLIEAQTEKLFFDEVILAAGKPLSQEAVMAARESKPKVTFENISKAYNNVFGKSFSEKSYNLLYNTAKLAKESNKVAFAEAMEEVAGDFMNSQLDSQIKKNVDKNYQSFNDFSLENEFYTTINTMITMVPTSIQGAREEVNNGIKVANYYAANNYKPLLKTVKDNYTNGIINKEQAAKQVQLLNGLKEVSSISSPLIKQINESKDTDINKEYKKIEVFDNNLSIWKDSKSLTADISDEQKEKLIKQIEKKTVRNSKISQEAIQSQNKTEEQVNNNIAEVESTNIEKDFSPLAIAQIKDVKQLSTLKNVVQERVAEAKGKEKTKLNKALKNIDNQIADLTRVKEVKNAPIVEQEKQRINTLSLEDLNNESPFENENLSDDEQKAIADEISNRRNILENEANTVDLQGTKFVKGDKVSTDGNKTFWFVKGKDENNNLLLERTINGTKETTSISNQPSNKDSVVPYVEQKETIKEQPEIVPTEDDREEQPFGELIPEKREESSNNLTNTPESQDIPLPIEDKKADIERRRQEELKQVKGLPKTKEQIEKGKVIPQIENDLFNQLKKETTSDNFNTAYEELFDKIQKLSKSKPNTKEREEYLRLIELQKQLADKVGYAIKDVNSGDKGETISNLIKSNEEDINKLPNTLVRNTEEIGKINAKYDAELANLNTTEKANESTQVTDQKIEETSKEIVKETEAENKAEVVKWENSAKRQNYFGTSVKQNDAQWESVLTDLKEQSEKEGKTYSELGYFITVMPETQFPKEAKTQKDKDWEKQVKEGTAISNGVKITQADLDTARYAVITDKEGNFKKFDGNVVYSYIPKVSKTEKKGVYSLGVDKSYTNQKELETLYNLRSQDKPVTLEIQSISQGFPKLLPQQKTPLTSVITGSQKPFVTISDKQYPVQMNKISSELANALILLSRVEIKSPYLEQLPENLRDYASRFRYIQEVFYNKLGGKISLNKDGSITSKGEIIDDKQARKLLLDSPINYTPSILDIPFTYITFKENKFEAKEYKTGSEFIAENSLYTPTESTIAQYINFGQEILPKPVETPKTEETKEVSITTDNPVTRPLKEITAPKRTVKGISKDKKADDLLKRGKSLVQNTTEKQNKEAEEWFNNSPISKHINLKDFRNIVNSDAWATWTSSALTLWKGSNLTDLYHEAWHEFSQLYLTKEQKQALYKELGKEGISNFDAEELIAEDFQKYVLSGQKLILGNSPKRNSIFRKIYNFLKELITGSVDLQTYYERLYNGNINKYQRDLNNAEFGKLNKSIDGITEGQTKDVMSALDRAIASEFEDRGLVMTYLFSKKGVLQNTYNVLNNYYANQSNLAQDVYNQKLEEFGKNPTDTKLAELNEIKLTYDNLNFLLDNWDSITKFHKDNSKYLQIAKEAIDDSSEDEEDIKLTDLYDSDNTTSSKDQASKRVLYTIASLPKFVGDQAIANPFIPVQLVQEEDGGKIKDYINPDVVDFDKTWNLLSKTLQNTYNYNQIYAKIENLAKTRHEFDYLLPKLPNATQQLTEAEMNIKHQFIQDLSKPLNKFYKVILSLDDNGDLVTKTYKSGASATKVIGENFTANFQTSEPTEYIKPNANSVNELDVEKIVNDFRKGIKSDRHTRLDFLNAIGFKLDEKTLAVSVVQDLLRGKNIEEGKDPIYKIFQSLDEYNKNKTSFTPTITNPVKQLSKGLKTGENVIYSNAKEAIEKILELEVEYNDDYYSDSITNAAGDPIWQIEKWSLQTLVYNHLSDVETYPTYEDLTKSPLGFIFDINTNPDMDNVYINSMFDLSTGKRRTDKQGKPITIEIINQDGLEIQPEKTEREGGKTTNLTPNDKFIQDFNSLLTTGVKEHVRYGDKNSAKGTLITTFKDETGRDTGFLPVPIESFNSNKLPLTAKVDLRRILNSELTRTKDLLTQNLGSNWKNFNKNGKKLGLFDGIIKGELASSILEDLKTLTPKQTIDKHSVKISEAVEKYFEQESKKTKKLLGKIPLDTNQKINSKLLDRNSEETLIKAYTVNNWILNADHVRLMFSDPRFFKNSKDSFKRFSLGSSNGLIAINDDQTNEALNRLFPNTQYQKAGWTGTETTNVNTVIFNEDIRKSKFYDIYKKFWMEVGKKTSEQADELLAPLTEMKIGDGQGWGTLDFIRRLKLKQGSDHWTLEHEALYKKIVNNELLSTEELGRAGMIFPVKIRVAGWTQDKSGKAVPIDYKFAVVPLLPQALKNTPFEEIHNNMLKQGVGIGLFESGSKHSAIMNSPTEFNKFYDNEEKTIPYTGEYITNSINYDFIFDVLNVEPKLKDEVTFSTQLRRLLFSNFFKDGKPTNPELYNKFNKAIQGLVDIEKENILKKVNAKWNETTKQYDIDEAKFGAYLEEEFDRRNLPDNAKEILKINKEGKFQYPLDASVMRQTIESIAISIIDGKLRKQKGFGEALIQQSSSGFEQNSWKFDSVKEEDILKYGTNGFPFYSPNENKTTAAKIGVSIATGDFKKLLKLKGLDNKPIETLDRLNEAIKDDNWLNQDSHRQMISLTAVRIPVQGHNSMEFMEVYHFLPETAGNVIVVSPELVAKSGGDFDVDKLTTLFNQYYVNEDGQVELFEELTDSQIDKKYEVLTKSIFSETGDIYSDKLIDKIFGKLIKEELELSFGNTKLPSKEKFKMLYKKAALQNSLNQTIREVLESPENFRQLMLPNSTDIFEPSSDELKKAKLGEETNYWSDIASAKENYQQFASNLGGKKSLGIGAVYNTFFAGLQSVGAYLNFQYVDGFGKEKPVNIYLEHNTTKDDHVSVSRVFDKSGKHLISESISQLMNGWVDIAKKDWVFYMNGIQEVAPTQLYMLMTGVSPETMQAFTNQPIIDDYLEALQANKSLIVKLSNPTQYKEAKLEALTSAFEKYLPWNENGEFIIEEPVKGGVRKNIYKKSEIRDTTNIKGTDIKNVYLLRSKLSKYGKIDANTFSLDKLKPVSLRKLDADGLEQVQILTHFLQLQDQAQALSFVNKALNADRSKPAFLHKSALRYNSKASLEESDILPKPILDKLYEETTTAAFNSQKTGIDKFTQELFGGKQLFKLTNHPTFNQFISTEWNKDADLKFSDKFKNEEEWFKTIKNDLISFIYQNYVIKPFTNQLVTDGVVELMAKSKTLDGVNQSLGDQLLTLKKQFPELTKTNSLLNLLTIDNSKKRNIISIKLKKDNVDADLSNQLSQDFDKLLNFSDLSASENQLIQNFAKNLANFAFVQSGLNKSPLSFTQIIPQEHWSEGISPIIDEYTKYLDKGYKETKDELDKFYKAFKTNNSKFYTIKDELDEGTPIKTVGDRQIAVEPYRFKDYRIANVNDQIANKKELNAIQKLAKEKNKVLVTDFNAELPSKQPKILFIGESDKNMSSTAGSGVVNTNKPENVILLPLKNKASNKPGSYFSDEDYISNTELISKAIAKIQIQSQKYSKLAFPTEGFLTSINKLMEDAPKTGKFLVSELFTKLHYIDNSLIINYINNNFNKILKNVEKEC